ncbi:MAG: tyrosine--tRNA ligase [Chitinivibrionales bacterium]|nr:tyrosine--tRNA ligase [Chitinivibrionales bacterium]
MHDFIAELRFRGMVHDIIPGTEQQLALGCTTGYIGFDPTAPSLTIGNLVTIMLLLHFQHAGHKPLALVGGATGMIGDPSGKSEERRLLSREELLHNQERIQKQLEKFLDFSGGPCKAEIVNNYEWMKDFALLDFLRDVGKHLTVNYMLAKDSVKSRLESGMSFTEFSYQLLQGYDFYWLHQNKGCLLQMGGSDQWGNITAGVELIRRKAGASAFAATVPLLTKSDGSKFGKSESGNVWLDPALSSPYKYYQFWLNVADADAERFIKIFTLFTKEQINALIAEHQKAPHLRALQKTLAKDITIRTHSETDYTKAVEASEILFGSATAAALLRLSEKELLEIFEGVPRTDISRSACEAGVDIVALTVDAAHIFASRGEARRLIAGGGVFVNKEKVADEQRRLTVNDLLCGKYLLIQKGKKNYHLVVAAG